MNTSLGAITVDLYAAARSLETANGVIVTDPLIRPTVKFLAAFAKLLAERWKRAVTLTQAWQVWVGMAVWESWLQEQYQQRAEVSAWLNIDSLSLSQTELVGLLANVPRIKAQQKMESGNYDPDDFEGVFQLVLIATGDEQQALKARSMAIQNAARRK